MALWVNTESCNFYSQHVYIHMFSLFNMTYVYKTYIIYTTELQRGGQLLEQPKFKRIIVTIHWAWVNMKEVTVSLFYRVEN